MKAKELDDYIHGMRPNVLAETAKMIWAGNTTSKVAVSLHLPLAVVAEIQQRLARDLKAKPAKEAAEARVPVEPELSAEERWQVNLERLKHSLAFNTPAQRREVLEVVKAAVRKDVEAEIAQLEGELQALAAAWTAWPLDAR